MAGFLFLFFFYSCFCPSSFVYSAGNFSVQFVFVYSGVCDVKHCLYNLYLPEYQWV